MPANQREPRSAHSDLTANAARGVLAKTIPETIPWDVVRGGLQSGGIVSAVNNLALAFARLERAMGIEPTSVAWEATALPLSYARVAGAVYALGRGLRKKSAQCGCSARAIPALPAACPGNAEGLQSRRLEIRGVGAEAPPTTGIQCRWFTSPHLPHPARHTAGQGRQRRAVLRSCRRSSRTARCRARATGRWWWRGLRCSRSPTAWSARPAPPTRSCGRS